MEQKKLLSNEKILKKQIFLVYLSKCVKSLCNILNQTHFNKLDSQSSGTLVVIK